MPENIGFIGLGNMGQPMVSNLLTAGYGVRVYNRTPGKAQALVAQGAEEMRQPSEVAKPGTTVITMVADDRALEAVVLGENGILERLNPGGIHLSMSTIAPATARKLAHQHAAHGSTYVAAPVFGRPQAVAARQIWICLSGPVAARERVHPILQTLGQGVFSFGDDPAAANVVKLVGNFLIASAIEAMAEGLTLAEKNGISRAAVTDMLSQTLFACLVYKNYGALIAEQRYRPAGFKLSLGLKDIDLVLQTAAASKMPMPVASQLHDRLIAAMAKGREDLDWAAIAINVAEDAGLLR
jgi:3-hydroxyisobutyrate dehydrogenase-like beta-hydroxyacid dehydrogenase